MNYAKDDRLKVRIDTICNNLPATLWDEDGRTVVSRVLPAGKSEVVILGQHLESLMKKIEDKWDVFEMAKNVSESALAEARNDEQRKKQENNKNAYAQFRLLAKRDLRPIRKIEVLENLGRVVTNQTVLEEQMVDKKGEREMQKMQLETMQAMMAELLALKKENEALKAETKKK